MTNRPWKGRGQVTWTIKILVGINHYLWNGYSYSRHILYNCTMVGYVKSHHMRWWRVTRSEQVRPTGEVGDTQSRRRSNVYDDDRRLSKPLQVRRAQVLATRQRM